MSNKIIRWGGLLLILLLFGCGTNNSEAGNPDSNKEKVGDIAFEHFQIEDIPKEIQSAIKFKTRKEATFTLPGDDGVYIIITRGELPTSGYTVEITNVEEFKNSIVVSYKYKDPSDDELVTQALTYSNDIVKIKRTDKRIQFQKTEHVNEKNQGLDMGLQ